MTCTYSLLSNRAVLSFERGTLPPIPRRAIFHNAMFDYVLLVKRNPEWLTKCEPDDTMIMANVLGFEDLSLKGLSNQLFGVKVFDYTNRHEGGKETYNAQDVFLTRQLYEHFLPQLDGSAYDIDRSIIRILTYGSLFSGYEIDHKKLEEVIAAAEAEVTVVEKIFDHEYPGVNMSSPEQLLQIFPTQDTTKETLLALDTPEAHLVLRRRQLGKELSTYLRPNQYRGTMSGLYRLTLAAGDHGDEEGGTTTGRLSSHDPNMQNIKPSLQQCLRAPQKHELLMADYDQIELRCIAEITQDKRMIKELREGKDFHAETAKLLGQPRSVGKTWNFARWYGAEAPTLSQRTGLPVEVCLELMRIQDTAYPGQREWGEHHWAQVQATGFSISPAPFRHRRRIHLFNPRAAKRQALNHPAQSMAGYITKAAMAEIGFEPDELEFVNQIHDELHYIIQKGDKRKRDRVKEAMLEVGNKYLPTVKAAVSINTSRYWNKEA